MPHKSASFGNPIARPAKSESTRPTKRRKFHRRRPRNQISTALTPDTSASTQKATINPQMHQLIATNHASTGNLSNALTHEAQLPRSCTDTALQTASGINGTNTKQVAQHTSRDSVSGQIGLLSAQNAVTEPGPGSGLAQTANQGNGSNSSCIELIAPDPGVLDERSRQLALDPYKDGTSLKRYVLESPRWNASDLKRLRQEKDDRSENIQAPNTEGNALPNFIPSVSPDAPPICPFPTLVNDAMRSLQPGQITNAYAFNLVLNVMNPDPASNILLQYHQLNGLGSHCLTLPDLNKIEWSRLFMIYHHRGSNGTSHWKLGVIFRECAQYMVYDPSASQTFRDQTIQELHSFVRSLKSTTPKSPTEWNLQPPNPHLPSHTDAIDSGIFVMTVVIAIFYDWSTIQCLNTGVWRCFFATLISPSTDPPQTAKELLLSLTPRRPTTVFSNLPRTSFSLKIQHGLLDLVASPIQSAENTRDQLLKPMHQILAAVEDNLRKTAQAMREVMENRKEIASIESRLLIIQISARELRASLERRLATALKVRAHHSHYRHTAGQLAARHRGKAFLEAVIADLTVDEERMNRNAHKLKSQTREALIGALRWLDSHASV